jgi:Domain of unknown function (DUF4185)
MQRRTLITAAALAGPLSVVSANQALSAPPRAGRGDQPKPAAAAGDVSADLAPGPSVPGPSLAELVAKLTGYDSINETDTKYQVMGTDLGAIWDNGSGQVLMAFGDTFGEGHVGGGQFGEDWRSNVLARSSDRDLSDGMTFDDMVVDEPGHAKELLASKKIDNDEITVIPNSGVSVGDRQFIHYFSQHHWGPWNTNYGGLAYSDDNGQNWTKSDVRWENSAPRWDRYFQIGSLVRHEGHVYLFGTGSGRFYDIRLARVREDDMLDLAAWRYWNGAGWGRKESDAVPVVAAPSGELSVLYNDYLGRWVMMYLDENRAAVVMREAPRLTGPWSGQRVVVRGGEGGEWPALYAPFIHPWSAASGEQDLYFAMSQWGPYNVFLLRTRLDRAVDTANLLSDPGFEEQPDRRVRVPWYVSGNGGIDRDGQFAHAGQNNGFVRGAQGWHALTQAIVVQPRRRHRLTAWLRSSERVPPAGSLGVRGRTGTIAQKSFGHLADYTKVSLEFNPGHATSVEVFAGFWGEGADAWVQVDQVSLTAV